MFQRFQSFHERALSRQKSFPDLSVLRVFRIPTLNIELGTLNNLFTARRLDPSRCGDFH
jgi:hypothetical protein